MSQCNHLWYTVEGDTVCRKCQANWPKPSAPTLSPDALVGSLHDRIHTESTYRKSDKSTLIESDTKTIPLRAREWWVQLEPYSGTMYAAFPITQKCSPAHHVHVIEYAAYEHMREQFERNSIAAGEYSLQVDKLERELDGALKHLEVQTNALTKERAELLTCKGDLACALTDLSDARAELDGGMPVRSRHDGY